MLIARQIIREVKWTAALFRREARKLTRFTPRRCGIRLYKAMRLGLTREGHPYSPAKAAICAAAVEVSLGAGGAAVLMRYHVIERATPYLDSALACLPKIPHAPMPEFLRTTCGPDPVGLLNVAAVFGLMCISNVLINRIVPKLSYYEEFLESWPKKPLPLRRGTDTGLDQK